MGPEGDRPLVLLAVALLPADRRDRCREQWLADLRDCAEGGIAPGAVAVGALRSALSVPRPEGPPVKPIGPVALALCHSGAPHLCVVGVVLALLLLIGVGLLVL